MAVARKIELLIIDPAEDNPWRIDQALDRLTCDLVVFERDKHETKFTWDEEGAYNRENATFLDAIIEISRSRYQEQERKER